MALVLTAMASTPTHATPQRVARAPQDLHRGLLALPGRGVHVVKS